MLYVSQGLPSAPDKCLRPFGSSLYSIAKVDHPVLLSRGVGWIGDRKDHDAMQLGLHTSCDPMQPRSEKGPPCHSLHETSQNSRCFNTRDAARLSPFRLSAQQTVSRQPTAQRGEGRRRRLWSREAPRRICINPDARCNLLPAVIMRAQPSLAVA